MTAGPEEPLTFTSPIFCLYGKTLNDLPYSRMAYQCTGFKAHDK